MCYTENFSTAPHSVKWGRQRLLGMMSASFKVRIETLKNHQPNRTVHRLGKGSVHCQCVESPSRERHHQWACSVPYSWRSSIRGDTLLWFNSSSSCSIVRSAQTHTYRIHTHTHMNTQSSYRPSVPPSLSPDVGRCSE